MLRIITATVLVFCLINASHGFCCFRDPLMLTPNCGCFDDTPCGVVKCPKACANAGPICSNLPVSVCSLGTASNGCDCGQPTNIGSNICDCGIPICSCYRDTSNICFVRDEPSPMCSCLKAAKVDCGYKSGCKCRDTKSFVYFPEVEYPVLSMEMKPYFYGGCYTY